MGMRHAHSRVKSKPKWQVVATRTFVEPLCRCSSRCSISRLQLLGAVCLHGLNHVKSHARASPSCFIPCERETQASNASAAVPQCSMRCKRGHTKRQISRIVKLSEDSRYRDIASLRSSVVFLLLNDV
eukprot:scaffold291823_cov33-Tisochrysis_lutea.AAC.7